MSIIRVGLAETKKFAEGYDAIFGKKKDHKEKDEATDQEAADKKESAKSKKKSGKKN